MNNKEKFIELYKRSLVDERVKIGKFMTEEEFLKTQTTGNYFAFGYRRVAEYEGYSYCFEKSSKNQWIPIDTRRYFGPFKEGAVVNKTAEFIQINLGGTSRLPDTIEIFKVDKLDHDETAIVTIVKRGMFSSSKPITATEFEARLDPVAAILFNSTQEKLTIPEFEELKQMFLDEIEHRNKPENMVDKYLNKFSERIVTLNENTH